MRSIIFCLAFGLGGPAHATLDLEQRYGHALLNDVGGTEPWIAPLRAALRTRGHRKAQITTLVDVSGSAWSYRAAFAPMYAATRALIATTYGDISGITVYMGHEFRLEVEPRPNFRLDAGGGTDEARGIYGVRTATYFDADVDHFVIVLADFAGRPSPALLRDLQYLNEVSRAVILVDPSALGNLFPRAQMFDWPRTAFVTRLDSAICEAALAQSSL